MASDLKRIYVVEVFRPADANGSASGVNGHDQWLSVHRTDNQDEAVRVAQEEHDQRHCNTRVRQFWVESFAAPQTAPKTGPVAVKVPMVPFTCMDHRDRRISVHETARAPRCPDCRTSMVPVTMAEAMDKELKP